VMHSKIVPNEHPMEIGAGDIVRLNIHTNVVTKVAEDIVFGANGTQTSDPVSRMLDTSTNMCRQSRIPRLDGKDDGHLDAVVVMPILVTVTMYRYGPPPSAVTLLQCHPNLVNINQPPASVGAPGTHREGGDSFKPPTCKTARPGAASGSLR
jgi:hypothetical protein